jgi:hypothetical protein
MHGEAVIGRFSGSGGPSCQWRHVVSRGGGAVWGLACERCSLRQGVARKRIDARQAARRRASTRSKRGSHCRAPIPHGHWLTTTFTAAPVAFRAYVEQVLAPTVNPGDIVVMDNLPDFNPIENAYAKFKSLLRQAAARTVEALETAIADAFHAFTPQECANYFVAAGYGSV